MRRRAKRSNLNFSFTAEDWGLTSRIIEKGQFYMISQKRQEIVLIGPCFTGKTTTALCLSRILEKRVCSVDRLRWRYFHESGYDVGIAKRLQSASGGTAVQNYWKPFELIALETMALT